MKLIKTNHKEIELMQKDTALDNRDLANAADELLPNASNNLKNKFIDRENLNNEPEYVKALLESVIDSENGTTYS
ncbi:hypothetical protein [Photobacterium piscicola]|uniref:hypothetical protein n=1 Tax=Photobacterium piscicola TaxID=1378299 RepID=UPI003736D60F